MRKVIFLLLSILCPPSFAMGGEGFASEILSFLFNGLLISLPAILIFIKIISSSTKHLLGPALGFALLISFTVASIAGKHIEELAIILAILLFPPILALCLALACLFIPFTRREIVNISTADDIYPPQEISQNHKKIEADEFYILPYINTLTEQGFVVNRLAEDKWAIIESNKNITHYIHSIDELTKFADNNKSSNA